MEIYLLRHGQTVSPGTYTGISDTQLSEEGFRQVRSIAPLLAEIQPEHCYSSPLIRCRKSVELLDLECFCSYDDDLREVNFGRWEGLSFAEISDNDEELLRKWLTLKDGFTFPGGDSVSAFHNRIATWFCSLLMQETYERILVVAHAGVIRAGLCYLLTIDARQAFSFEVQEAALSCVAHEAGHSRLVYLNRRST